MKKRKVSSFFNKNENCKFVKSNLLLVVFFMIFILILIMPGVLAEISIIKYYPTVYASKNIGKTVSVGVKNSGDSDLTTVSLSLSNINGDFYSVKPMIIDSIKPGEIKTFEIDFLIKDFIGEESFNYIVKSGDISVNAAGKLVVLTVKEYFINEIGNIGKEINKTRNNVEYKDFADELGKCQDLLNKAKANLKNEEFIDLNENIKKTNECLIAVESSIVEKPATLPKSTSISFPKISIPKISIPIISISIPKFDIDYGKIAIIMSIFILVLFLIYFAYGFYKKLKLVDFFERESRTIVKNPAEIDYIDEKIREIQRKL